MEQFEQYVDEQAKEELFLEENKGNNDNQDGKEVNKEDMFQVIDSVGTTEDFKKMEDNNSFKRVEDKPDQNLAEDTSKMISSDGGGVKISMSLKTAPKLATPEPPPKAPIMKLFTRSIPKYKRNIPKPMPITAKVEAPTDPKKDPAPLKDFLQLGSQAKLPVVRESLQPPDPKAMKEKSEEEKDLKMLGIDSSDLKAKVTPKAPPPPSQNLSLPPGMKKTSDKPGKLCYKRQIFVSICIIISCTVHVDRLAIVLFYVIFIIIIIVPWLMP